MLSFVYPRSADAGQGKEDDEGHTHQNTMRKRGGLGTWHPLKILLGIVGTWFFSKKSPLKAPMAQVVCCQKRILEG